MEANSELDCKSCGRKTDPELSFCLQCGEKVGAHGHIPAQTCPSCGITDSLNDVFCIVCGSALAQPGTAEVTGARRKSLVQPPSDATLEHPAFSRRVVRTPGRTEVIDKKPKGIPAVSMAVLALAGIGVGIAVSCFVLPDFFEMLVARTNWPARGLVIYALPPSAKVMVNDLKGQHFVAGQTGPEGALSIKNIPSGEYQVTISMPGYKSQVRSVSVKEKKPMVIGFPEKVQLKKDGDLRS